MRQNLESASRKLAGFPAPRLEAEILLAHALGSPRSFLYANPDLDLPVRHVDRFRKLVSSAMALFIRLGNTSSASMELEISKAMTMSLPR